MSDSQLQLFQLRDFSAVAENRSHQAGSSQRASGNPVSDQTRQAGMHVVIRLHGSAFENSVGIAPAPRMSIDVYERSNLR